MMHQPWRSATLFFAAACLTAGAAVSSGVSAVAATQPPSAARAVSASGGWGTAREIPGTAALNTGGWATFSAVSCTASGTCTAGGNYATSTSVQAYVVSQANGTWGTAQEVPGIATLDRGHYAEIVSVSCTSAGNCGAGGYYATGTTHQQAFVVSETNGTWGTAKEVPGSGALNKDSDAGVQSVSCASAGNCSVGGYYIDASGFTQAFVDTQTNGTWGTAKEVPGTATLNTGGDAGINSVSCTAAGTCSAGGYYLNKGLKQQALVVSETDGVWRKAKEVPGTAALNPGGLAEVDSVSCTAAGTCSAGGQYGSGGNGIQAFVVSQTNGTWGTAEEVPGTSALNQLAADVTSVSCTAAGTCSAGGYYTASGHHQAFVVSQSDGTWGTAKEVPGTATLNQANAEITSVSCASAGTCSAGGYYGPASGTREAFVVSQTGGTWGTAEEVPGTGTLNKHGAAATGWVSCAPAGTCSAGGYYTPSAGTRQVFVVSQA